MIPTRLTLRNFMSYGDEPTELEFAGMHVACLSGDNGNGKSALLDAITFALWGKTRASGSQASSDDDLVRLGAEEMEVRLEFQLGDDRFRAVRKRNRRTRSGDWQLHLCDAAGAWKPVGGTGMRETEAQLVRLLRMEYETFLNSAYIQQGRADEFTRQKPDKRKQILADILDLKRYDRLETLAKDRKNDCELVIKDLDGEIRALEARAAEAAGHRERLAGFEAEAARWAEERAARDERLAKLRDQLAALEEKQQRLDERLARLADVETEQAEIDRQISANEARIAAADQLLAQRARIETDLSRLNELRASLSRLETDVAALAAARQERTAAAGRLDVARQKLAGEVRHAELECKAFGDRASRIDELGRQLETVAPQLALLERAEQDLAAARRSLDQADQRLAELKATHKRLTDQKAELDEVIAVLESPRSACPVCESDLSGGRQQAVLIKQRGKRTGIEQLLTDVKQEGIAVRKEREELQARVTALDEKRSAAAALKARQADWHQELSKLMLQNAGQAESGAKLASLRRQLETGGFAIEEQEAIKRLDASIAGLEAATAGYAAAQEEARTLTETRVEARHAELLMEEQQRGTITTELTALRSRREKRAGQIAAEKERLAALRAELADIDTMRRQTAEADTAAREAAARLDAERAQAERCCQALEDCAAAAELAAKKLTEREKAAKDKQAYTELAQAFGKKGVQAIIIHNALPEIEEEANRLLARMTENAMRVTLDTQRQARSGGAAIETLDITITDDAGTRPYEMYSGGEAFRVNFAIRIALSRLLARRAGARLQTLIIDEGFGTQDAKGRERLAEAINSVADEFALILVITHVEELKDAFPTRIEVIKTPSGSQINLLD